MKYVYRLATVNLFLGASLIVAGFYGKVVPFFVNDSSGLSYAIAFLIATNIMAALYEAWSTRNTLSPYPSGAMRWMRFNYGKLIYIGLLGTFFGLKEIVSGFNSADDPAQLIAILKSGAMTLASCSIIGLVGYLWASLNFYLMGEE